MKGYSHILCCIDLGAHSQTTTQKAIELANTFQAKIDLLHIIEPPLFYLAGFELTASALEEMQASARTGLMEFAKKMKLSKKQCHLSIGSAKAKILENAIKLNCDLLILGSHGAGANLISWLGTTANAVLQQAKCDVLIVQVNPLKAIPDPNMPMPPFTYAAFSHATDWLGNTPVPDTRREKFGIKKSADQPGTHGFGQDIDHGPKPGLRPASAPYGRNKKKKED